MLLIAIIIGSLIGALVGIYVVYAVVFVYKYKGTSKASMVRGLGVSSGAVVASFGSFLIKYFFGNRTELDLGASIAFGASAIISMVVFFWINRKKIG